MKVTLSKVQAKDIISTTNLEMEWEDICYIKNNLKNKHVVNGYFKNVFYSSFGEAVMENSYDMFLLIENDQLFNLKNNDDAPYLEEL